jgi:predicted MFS family arabinose efflux permease
LAIDAATFLLCGGLLVDLRPHVEETEGDSVQARLRAALEHLGEVPVLRKVLIVEAIALIFFEAAAPVELPYVKVSLHGGNPDYGLLMSAWGAGVVFGSIFFARAARRPLAGMLALGALAVGGAYVGFAAAPSVALACAAAVVGGFGQGVQWASLISAVQLLTPPDLQGRMMGAVESIGAITPPFGLLLGGGIAALTSPRWAMLAVGIGAVITTPAFARLPVRRPAAPPAAGELLST